MSRRGPEPHRHSSGVTGLLWPPQAPGTQHSEDQTWQMFLHWPADAVVGSGLFPGVVETGSHGLWPTILGWWSLATLSGFAMEILFLCIRLFGINGLRVWGWDSLPAGPHGSAGDRDRHWVSGC